MISNRTKKAKEMLGNKNILEVINLWDTTDDSIDVIAKKLTLTKKEIELILITYEATKMLKGIKLKETKENLIKINDTYLNYDEILTIEPVIREAKESSEIYFKADGGNLSFIGITCDEIYKKIKEKKENE